MPVESDNTILELGKFIADIRPLFEEIGAVKLFDPVYAMYTSFRDPTVRITVTGGSNCGKSRFANHLLGQSMLPVTSVPSDSKMTVFSQQGVATGWSLEGESKIRPMEQLSAYLNGPASGARPVVIYIQNSLLGEHPFRLAEQILPSSEAPNYENLLRQRIYSSDIILLVMDAHAALKRDEVRFFQACVLYSFTPTVVLTKTDTLTDEEQEIVLSYVRMQLELSAPEDLLVCAGKECIEKNAEGRLREWLLRCSAQENVAKTRCCQIIFALSERLEGLRRDAQAGVDSLQLEQADKEKILREKQNHFEGQRLIWDSIDVELAKRQNTVIEFARDALEQAEEEMYKELVHRLDKTGDVKTWWEKDLPHDLQFFDTRLQKVEREIQQKIVQDFQWLCRESSQRFKSTLSSFAPSLIDCSSPEAETLKQLNFSDAERLKTISRMGTVVAVVAGGTLLATAGVGVAVMAVGALVGLVGEKYVKYKVGQDKELAKPELRKLIAQARMECMQKLSRQITGEYSVLAAILREQQRMWEEKSLNAIEKELETGSSQTLDWGTFLQKINTAIVELNQLVR